MSRPPSYTPEYAPILNDCPLCVPANSSHADFKDWIPAAPLVVPVPLPSSTLTVSTHSTNLDFYPISLLSHPPLYKEIRLRKTLLTSPIHVHTPHAHIGTIHTAFPDQRVSGLEVILWLKNLARLPLSFHGMYTHLIEPMRDEVQAAFFHRHGQLSSFQTAIIWEEFTAGIVALNGPIGEDLFLGNTDVWGVEANSIQGHSIIHLA